MKKAIIIISLTALYSISCSAQQSSTAITYDKLDSSKTSGLELSTDVVIHSTSRISTMTERSFCENQTLDVNLSRRFENMKRISVDLSVEKNGKKLSRADISKASNKIEDYKFYDMRFTCMNGVFGVRITGYKFGLNGDRPSADVFKYYASLETGEVVEVK